MTTHKPTSWVDTHFPKYHSDRKSILQQRFRHEQYNDRAQQRYNSTQKDEEIQQVADVLWAQDITKIPTDYPLDVNDSTTLNVHPQKLVAVSASDDDSYSSTSSSTHEYRRHKRSKRSKKRKRSLSPNSSSSDDSFSHRRQRKPQNDDIPKNIVFKDMPQPKEEFVGPQKSMGLNTSMRWNWMLQPGEGDAMAAFVAQNKRIPRRGEVGFSSEEIEHFENVGYVMSGSRNSVIENMRKKKEEMVLTPMQQQMKKLKRQEDRSQRENQFLAQMRNRVRMASKK